MKTAMYELEIYRPDSGRDVCVKFTSASPFQAIHVGDILNPREWDATAPVPDEVQGKVLLVKGVEHFIYEAGETINHKVMIYTTARLDREGARLPWQDG
jgi:hypothetical protein